MHLALVTVGTIDVISRVYRMHQLAYRCIKKKKSVLFIW